MWVLKLGGSLYKSKHLAEWLQRVARHAGPVVLVPGGGPFADQVRQAQCHWHFDDSHAHAMALRAMEQFGSLLCAVDPRYEPADGTVAIQEVLARGRIPVWFPVRQILGEATVEASWRVTSDSLALWLAAELNAHGVVLVKSAALPPESATIGSMQGDGLLDESFEGYAGKLDCPIHVIDRGYQGDLDAILMRRAGRCIWPSRRTRVRHTLRRTQKREACR